MTKTNPDEAQCEHCGESFPIVDLPAILAHQCLAPPTETKIGEVWHLDGVVGYIEGPIIAEDKYRVCIDSQESMLGLILVRRSHLIGKGKKISEAPEKECTCNVDSNLSCPQHGLSARGDSE